jgi:hypothetical protein
MVQILGGAGRMHVIQLSVLSQQPLCEAISRISKEWQLP